MSVQPKKLTGNILLEKGIITQAQLDDVLNTQKLSGGFFCNILMEKGYAKPSEVYPALSQHLGVEYCDLQNQTPDPEALERISIRVAVHYNVIPLRVKDGSLILAMSDPHNHNNIDELAVLADCPVTPVLSYDSDITEAIKQYYGVGADILDQLSGDDRAFASSTDKEISDIETAAEDASIIKFVNELFMRAVDERATDIHMEPYEKELRVRFRIDGFLYDTPIPESISLFHAAIVSRVKIMADLDIAEHRVPQDGRIKIRVRGEDVEFRVSILPSSFGESVQVRILGSGSFLDLEHIGFSVEDLVEFRKLINKPHGVIFITGPTGSGKSTTLYAALKEKNKSDIKIITTEDPVENLMRGIVQVQINPRSGLTFAESLRSILRHDPDVIMVGEVRDCETAEITIRSAMTGHLVLSSVHTNDAAGAPTRLIDMGIEPFLVASSLEGVIAQRLVRKICLSCRIEEQVSSDVFRQAGIAVKEDKVKIFHGKGCPDCRNTGFQGRTAIFEIFRIDDQIRTLIGRNVPAQELKRVAVKNGMLSLRYDGLMKVLEGITSLSEVLRVT